MNPSFLIPPLVNVHQPTASSSQNPPIFPAAVPLIMAQIPPRNFVTWNNECPLIPLVPPVVWGPIPSTALKVIPKFTGECPKTLGEHLQDVANVFMVHGIMEQNVSLRFLIASFKERALD